MATWPHAGMHMTKASTQAREAFADAYRCGRQNVYFGLPKLTSESAKLTMSLELKHFLFVPLFLNCLLIIYPFLQCKFYGSHGTSMKSKSQVVLVKTKKLIFSTELSSLRVVSW